MVSVWRITSEGDPSSVAPAACCASRTSCRLRRRPSADGIVATRCCMSFALRRTLGSHTGVPHPLAAQPVLYFKLSTCARTITGFAQRTVLSTFSDVAQAGRGREYRRSPTVGLSCAQDRQFRWPGRQALLQRPPASTCPYVRRTRRPSRRPDGAYLDRDRRHHRRPTRSSEGRCRPQLVRATPRCAAL